MQLFHARMRHRERRPAPRFHRRVHAEWLPLRAPHPADSDRSHPAQAHGPDPLRRHMMRRARSGQATIEYVILLGGVIVPFIFGVIYLAQMLWIWHSVGELSRAGASYAATHCWQASADN